MQSEITKTKTASIDICGILFIVFLVLKLTGTGQVANWSWWWVTSPLWIPLAIVVIIMIVVVIAAIILGIISIVLNETYSQRLARKRNKLKFQEKLEEIAKNNNK